jgi:hypothetical protein
MARQNPFGVVTLPVPNQSSQALAGEGAFYQRIIQHGGLQKLCCASMYNYDSPPYLRMPPEGRQFQQISSVTLPAATGVDIPVTTVNVPVGYDGVISSIANFWTGTTLVEGSGDIVWRIKVGNRWARDLGQITTTLGSLTSPCPVFRGGIRISSQQVVTYYVNVPTTSSLTGGNVVCALFGWFYPV